MRRRYLLPLLLLFCAPFLLGGTCGGQTVIRDATVYRTELGFMEQASVQTAEALKARIQSQCVCTDGKFVQEGCAKDAKLVLVIEARVPWHKAMALYNAGLLEERPPKTPPDVPDPSTLCPDTTPADSNSDGTTFGAGVGMWAM